MNISRSKEKKMKKVNIRRLCSLLMALIMISLLLTTAYATSYATYETYDCKNNYVSSRTWSIPAGNMRIKAVFDLGGIRMLSSGYGRIYFENLWSKFQGNKFVFNKWKLVGEDQVC